MERFTRSFPATPRRLHALLFAGALFAAGPLNGADAPTVALPEMGDASGAVLSPQEERRLGDAFMRSIRQSIKLTEDPVVEAYVRSLGNLLVGFSGHHPFDFTFFVVDDSRINAFAGPGGYIGVNSGLLLATESESEFASVVAHELAHVTQRHLLRSFDTANKLSVPTAAAVIAAIILGANNPQVAEALFAAGIAANAQTQLNFSRLHEQEADRIGIETLHQAGFDPRAMPVFFERLQQATRSVDGGAPDFLSTHPVTLSRIADSRGRAEQYQPRPVLDSVEYHIARARLLYLGSKQSPAQRLKAAETSLKAGKFRNEFAARYTYVLALTDAREFERAREQVSMLVERDRERVPYLLAQANVEIQSGDTKSGISKLEQALNLYPHDSALTFLLAQTLLDSGDVQRAYSILLNQGRFESSSPAYFQLLARAAERASITGEAHEAWAEFHYLHGRVSLAMEHLRTGLRSSDTSFYMKSRLEFRLKQLEEELQPGKRNRNPDDDQISASRPRPLG
jgi:predicted Zn-dependent protease